ncbi:MAG: transketolase, partial [Chloroflexi bacterium]|nr:transketolase [Chloroflexota bacterium]
VAATKANLGWPQEPAFHVPDEVRHICAERVTELKRLYQAWQGEYRAWREANPQLAAQYDAAMAKALPDDLEERLLATLSGKAGATRRLGGEAMAQIAAMVPGLVGGAADLAPSTSTYLKAYEAIAQGRFEGRNIHFGVREHAMGAILNGIALYGGYIPFGATFLVFADYMRPPIRLACLMGLQVIYVFTHDSIFVGEDGPTHEPVEQIASLRLIPGMTVIRPADGAEVAAAWAYALRHQAGPTALILTRQNVPPVKRQVPFSVEAFNRGAYIV